MDFKKLKYFLHKWDGIWSAPLAFLAFCIVGYILTAVFGFTAGTYDVGFVQPLLLAIVITVGATNAGILGIRFTTYTIFKWWYGKKQISGDVKNISKEDWRSITPIQRYIIALVLFIYFTTMIVFLYSKFI